MPNIDPINATLAAGDPVNRVPVAVDPANRAPAAAQAAIDGGGGVAVDVYGFPTDIQVVKAHQRQVSALLKQTLLNSGLNAESTNRVLTNLETRALRTGRKVTGAHRTNRDPRWRLVSTHPQYAEEISCRVIHVRLLAQIFCFAGAPTLMDQRLKEIMERYYLIEDRERRPVLAGSFKDSLLLEVLDFTAFIREAAAPKPGASFFHIGHQDPSISPKHVPWNIRWRSHRSNLIQGDMTLQQARVYIVKLIGRYFELGELPI